MPMVRIRTGFLDDEGQEITLSEYQCDWPGCGNLAEQSLGVLRDLGTVAQVCPEHGGQSSGQNSGAPPDVLPDDQTS